MDNDIETTTDGDRIADSLRDLLNFLCPSGFLPRDPGLRHVAEGLWEILDRRIEEVRQQPDSNNPACPILSPCPAMLCDSKAR